MCVLIFATLLSKILFILKKFQRGIVKMYIGLHVKCPIVLWDFNENLTFSKESYVYWTVHHLHS